MERLREHSVHLVDGDLRLRPFVEGDWNVLLRWNRDPEVLCYSEGDDVQAHTLQEVQSIYRGVSQAASASWGGRDGAPIGECWLQRMNLERISRAFPAMDLRHIDLEIGEKELWRANEQPLGQKAQVTHDLMLTRERYRPNREAPQERRPPAEQDAGDR